MDMNNITPEEELQCRENSLREAFQKETDKKTEETKAEDKRFYWKMGIALAFVIIAVVLAFIYS